MQLLQALVAGISLLITAFAQAQPASASASASDDDYINPDRPGIADGSNVVGAGRFQIETGIQYEYRNRTDNVRTLFLPTLVRLGLAKDLEVRIEGNTYTRVRSIDTMQGSIQSEGVAPASIGLKYHFVDSESSQRRSLGAILRFFPPSGSGSFRTAKATGDFRLAADWDFAPQWSLNPNVGIGVYTDDAQRLYTAGLFAVTLNYNPSKALNLFIDTGVQYPEIKSGRSSIIVDAGAAWVIGRNLQLDFSAGARVAGKTPPRLFLATGISQRF